MKLDRMDVRIQGWSEVVYKRLIYWSCSMHAHCMVHGPSKSWLHPCTLATYTYIQYTCIFLHEVWREVESSASVVRDWRGAAFVFGDTISKLSAEGNNDHKHATTCNVYMTCIYYIYTYNTATHVLCLLHIRICILHIVFLIMKHVLNAS